MSGSSAAVNGGPVLVNAVSIVALIGVAVLMLPVYLVMVAGSYRAGRYYYGS